MPLSREEERNAIQCFQHILNLCKVRSITDQFFEEVRSIIKLLKGASQTLIHEVFIQLLKQQNTNNRLSAILIYQLMVIYVYIFRPEKPFLQYAIKILYSKTCTLNQEKSIVQLLFSRLVKLVGKGIQPDMRYL